MNKFIDGMVWLHEPIWRCDAGSLVVTTRPGTDFWQRTHYGFRRDNGHALLKEVAGNIKIKARFTFEPTAQYDQCGMFIRVDETNWFKCSIEYENPSESRLGSVLTSNGYSDWATQDISSEIKAIWYEVEIKNSDITAKFSYDGQTFRQMRICRLNAGEGQYSVGIYGCSPIGAGFEFVVSDLTIVAA